MALIKLSSIGITNLSGKAGGSIFSRNRGGNYMKNFAVPVNTNTNAQELVRARFGSISAAWRQLEQTQRDGWDAAKELFPSKNTFGDKIILSGFGVFQKLNTNLATIGRTLLQDAPSPVGTDIFDSLSAAASLDSVTEAFTLNVTGTVVDVGGTSSQVLIYASPAISAGRKVAASDFRLITYKAYSVFEAGVDVTPEYLSVFAKPAADTRISIKVVPISIVSGERGPVAHASDLVEVVTTP